MAHPVLHLWKLALLCTCVILAFGTRQIASLTAPASPPSSLVYEVSSYTNISSPPASPAIPLAPGQVINLLPFKLQLPTAALPPAINEAIVSQPSLNTFTDPNLFFVDNNGTSVEFVCNAGGATTGGSHYPRTELAQKQTWDIGGTNVYTMRLTGAVQRLTPVRPVVVVAQIFGAASVLLQIRVTGTSQGAAQILAAPSSPLRSTVLASNYQLGAPYTIRLTGGSGIIRVFYGPGATVASATYLVNGTGLGTYFKAGNYLQSNNRTYTELGNATSQVSIYTLTLS